jgi:hypothetical protein
MRQYAEEVKTAASEVAAAYLETVAKGEADPSIQLSERGQEVLRDKTALDTAVAAAHDSHLLAIDSAEDSVSSSANGAIVNLVNELSEAEVRPVSCRPLHRRPPEPGLTFSHLFPLFLAWVCVGGGCGWHGNRRGGTVRVSRRFFVSWTITART